MSNLLDEPLIYRSRRNHAAIPPEPRNALLGRSIDVPEFPPGMLYRGIPVVASDLVAEYEPDVTMMLTLDSRRDVPVCVIKGGTPAYLVYGRWLVHPHVYAKLVRELMDRLVARSAHSSVEPLRTAEANV